MKLAFDAAFFSHINDSQRAETGQASRLMTLIEASISKPFVRLPLAIIEHVLTLILTLPIPVYATLVRMFVTNAPGLPRFSGIYLRPDERFAAREPQVWFSDEHGVVRKENGNEKSHLRGTRRS